MPQIKPSRRDERPDANPNSAPRTEITPSVDENASDEFANQRKKHLRRESCIRIVGSIGLVLAGCVVSTFGFETLSELDRQAEEGIEQHSLLNTRRQSAKRLVPVADARGSFQPW